MATESSRVNGREDEKLPTPILERQESREGEVSDSDDGSDHCPQVAHMPPRKRYLPSRLIRPTKLGGVFEAIDQVTNEVVVLKQSSCRLSAAKDPPSSPCSVSTSSTATSAVTTDVDALPRPPSPPPSPDSKTQLDDTDTIEELPEDPKAEAELLHRVQGHPNIIRMIASECHEDLQLLVLEFANGGDLLEHLNKLPQKRLGERQARRFFLRLVQALCFTHQQNICHLDVSLENILLFAGTESDDKLIPKLCDWGVARELSGQKRVDVHGVRAPGKLKCMAPEVLYQQSFDGRAADCFSCGVVLYVMLTGSYPWEEPTLADADFRLIMSGYSGLIKHLKLRGRAHSVPLLAAKLLSLILRPVAQRSTLSSVLAHPWLRVAPPTAN